MANNSITRKIVGKDKDICFYIDDQPRGIVMDNRLWIPIPREDGQSDDTLPNVESRAERRLLNKLINQAKRRDGVAGAKVMFGTMAVENNDVALSISEKHLDVNSFNV